MQHRELFGVGGATDSDRNVALHISLEVFPQGHHIAFASESSASSSDKDNDSMQEAKPHKTLKLFLVLALFLLGVNGLYQVFFDFIPSGITYIGDDHYTSSTRQSDSPWGFWGDILAKFVMGVFLIGISISLWLERPVGTIFKRLFHNRAPKK